MGAEKILVVDGDAEDEALTLATLRRAGYEVISSEFRQDLIEQVRSSGCDVVVADFANAVEPSLDLLQAMKSQHPGVSVIVLTADRNTETIIASMASGVYDYILKPYARDRLLDAVSRAATVGAVARERLNYSQGLEQLVEARTHMLRQAVTDLERSYDITLEALGDALDLKDAETEGHSKRVTAYTIALARAMGVRGAELRIMARGAFLHDIGKMAIPDAILLKPGKLNDEERTVMREHCLRAITSDRPYRQGKSFAHASGEIARCGRTQFDPAAVDVFLKMPMQVWEDLRIEILQRGQFHSITPPGVLDPNVAVPLAN